MLVYAGEDDDTVCSLCTYTMLVTRHTCCMLRIFIILERNKHPEHGYRACLGLLSLGKRYGNARLEAACERVLALGAYKYSHVRDILANNRDQLDANEAQSDWISPDHAHVRGPGHYQ